MKLSSWMHWSTSATAKTNASPDKIWDLWSAVGAWQTWDTDVEWSRLDGDFLEGTLGVLKPKGGPAIRFSLTSLKFGESFTNRSRLPLTTIDFIHKLRFEVDDRMIEHRLEMNGPLTFLFCRLIGTSIARGLPSVVNQLARAAEKSSR